MVSLSVRPVTLQNLRHICTPLGAAPCPKSALPCPQRARATGCFIILISQECGSWMYGTLNASMVRIDINTRSGV